ncbi:hypothetical protein COB57_01095 [Candidatus Peregrinibacteria bacterium]|nr:MAG: hypothetical protein COB57_01095 [Candidatus Peregrinibacteria bacterium]
MSSVAISDLQKSPAQALKNTHTIQAILQNNKMAGGLISPDFLKFITTYGILDEFEDFLLLQNKELQKRGEETLNQIKKNDYSQFATWDQVWK